ncbi:MAG: M14 family zinc carboxypeptidase [Acidobacteriota bacterium]
MNLVKPSSEALVVGWLALFFAAGLQGSAGAQEPAWLGERSDRAELALPTVNAKLPSPAEFLGYRLGERFTRSHEVRAYFEKLAAVSPRLELFEYGHSYEDRPLLLAAISSPENLARLAAIRDRQQLLANEPAGIEDEERQALVEEQPAILWLGYGVHGDESSSPEAALATAYLLAGGQGEVEGWLDETVVLIDPVSNPDGRERYIGDFEQQRGRLASSWRSSAEHRQRWPGGRFNHYLIDLNRDWSWATQIETRHRIAAYRQWEPVVHVDLHEMDEESSYFFPPSAAPLNPFIDQRVEYWLDIFGRGNAQAFDDLGWLYFKAEDFDLFYPGYGDSYPSLRGAVGMTYEMAGGGSAGTRVVLSDGSTLTLADRVARHLVTSLATLETTATKRLRLVSDFVASRLENQREKSPRTYLWEAGWAEAEALARLLSLHGIAVERLGRRSDLEVRPTTSAVPRKHRFQSGAYAVSSAQPLGDLARTLLETNTSMPSRFLLEQRQRLEQNLETEFYDITAWALPLAFQVPVWSSDQPVPDLKAYAPGANGFDEAIELPAARGAIEGAGRVGYLVPWGGLAGYRAAARLQSAGVRYRLALTGFQIEKQPYGPGSLFVPRTGNPENLDELIRDIAHSTGLTIERVGTSFSTYGISLGSDKAQRVRPVRIGLLGGRGIQATSFGALWHLLDRVVEAPVTRLPMSGLRDQDLAGLDVVVLPDGRFGNGEGPLGDAASGALERWLRSGGLLIAVGRSLDWLQHRELTDLAWREEESKPVPSTPGAAVSTLLNGNSPLTAGLTAAPAVLIQGSRLVKPLEDRHGNLLRVAESDPVVAGMMWQEAREAVAGTLLVGSERVDRGRLVYFAQDPAFRVFWRSTMPILLNAALHGPSWGVDRLP